MTWQPLALTWPAAAIAIGAAADGAVGGVAASMTAASARLSGVTGATFTAGPLASAATGASAARTALQALLDAPCWALSVDPWNAGSGEHLHRHLSPINAVDALTAKLRDAGDLRRPTGALDMVCVMVFASTLPAFAQQLAALNIAVPLFGFAQRRAQHLSDLETTKWLQPINGGPLHWERKAIGHQATARAADEQLGAAVAVLEGLDAENTSPIAELTAVIAKKTAAAVATNNALADLAQQIGGGTGSGLFASGGSLSALAANLSGGAPADHAYTLTAGLCLIAPTGKLDFFRELFGL